MRENKIEATLTHATRTRGGMSIKLTSPSHRGIPDRLIILPGGHIAFIELKAPGKTPTRQQTHRHNQLHNLGAHVYVIDHPNQIQPTLNRIQTTPLPNQSNQPHPQPS